MLLVLVPQNLSNPIVLNKIEANFNVRISMNIKLLVNADI